MKKNALPPVLLVLAVLGGPWVMTPCAEAVTGAHPAASAEDTLKQPPCYTHVLKSESKLCD